MRRALTLVGRGVLVVIILALIVVGGGFVVGGSRLAERYEVELADLAIPDDPAAVARGEHVARINGCTDCHGPALSGAVMIDAPPFRVVASNLTPGAGGIGNEYDARDLDRAIRHGVRPDGRPLLIMPSAAFHGLSDADAADLIAYLRQLPPVDNELPETRVRLMGRVMASFALDPAFEVRTGRAGPSSIPAKGPTAEYGAYLASVTCAYCHGQDLRGAQPPMPGSPFAPDIVAAADSWSHVEFVHALRTGERPDGRALNPEFMPYKLTAAMHQEQLDALYAYLAGL